MRKEPSSSSLSRINRNLIERERRSQMKSLFTRLFNLLPPQPTKMSIPELVEHATIYVSQLQKRMEELKRMKVQLEEIKPSYTAAGAGKLISPVMNILELDSAVEVDFMAGIDMKFALCDIISILEEEGAEVVNATYHNVGNRILLSIHSQAAYSRDGVANIRLHERLKRLQNLLKEFAP